MYGLIAYAIAGVILVAGLAWGWSKFTDWVGEPYAAAQRQADQVEMDKVNAARIRAEGDAAQMRGERDNARADTQTCVEKASTQSDAVNKWKAEAQRQANAAREARAAADRQATAAAPRLAQLQADAAAKPQLMVCEVELAKAKKVIQDALRSTRTTPPAAPK